MAECVPEYPNVAPNSSGLVDSLGAGLDEQQDLSLTKLLSCLVEPHQWAEPTKGQHRVPRWDGSPVLCAGLGNAETSPESSIFVSCKRHPVNCECAHALEAVGFSSYSLGCAGTTALPISC